MNFTEAVAEIRDSTKRPDKISLMRRKVNAAISFFSFDSDFPRDFQEQLVPVDATMTAQAVPLSTFALFRKFEYIKLAGTKRFLTPIPTSEFFKPGVNVCGRYYIVGDNVNLSMPALAPNLDVGYFKYPPTLTDVVGNNTYWMLDLSPYMIIDWAMAEVFKDIGDEKSFAQHRASAREQYLAFRRDQGVANQ